MNFVSAMVFGSCASLATSFIGEKIGEKIGSLTQRDLDLIKSKAYPAVCMLHGTIGGIVSNAALIQLAGSSIAYEARMMMVLSTVLYSAFKGGVTGQLLMNKTESSDFSSKFIVKVANGSSFGGIIGVTALNVINPAIALCLGAASAHVHALGTSIGQLTPENVKHIFVNRYS